MFKKSFALLFAAIICISVISINSFAADNFAAEYFPGAKPVAPEKPYISVYDYAEHNFKANTGFLC